MKKQWFKVVTDFGPGHQSQDIRWRYSYLESIQEQIQYELEREGKSNWIFKVHKKNKLPREVALELSKEHRSRIKFSRDMLKIIKESTVPYGKGRSSASKPRAS